MSPSFNPPNPLHHRTVLLACSEKKMSALASGLEALGARVLHLPVIELRAMEDTRRLDHALAALHEYSWIIFSSSYGVRFFMQRLQNRAVGDKPKAIPKICAIGPATAKDIKDFGYEVDLIPEQFVAEGVLAALERFSGGLRSLAGQRILIPRAEAARDLLPAALAASGAHVDVIPCYRNVRAEPDPDMIRQLQKAKPDLIVFTSSSAVRNMVDILGPEDGKRMLLESVVAVLGPITGSTAESFGKRAEILPRESTIASLIEEIRRYYSRNHSSIDRRQ
jgi:uroporphyrinogen III methyltransferase / synthase